eukprot:m.36133 g.36133  ORF g.36133 m.36133 type:complete len:239 (-) comp12837_c0_seq1:170-886(-)
MWSGGQGRAVPRRRDLPDRDFQDFTERVYRQKRDAINEEIAQLEKGTHPKYIEEVAQLKREHEVVLRENERYRQLEVDDIEEELDTTLQKADDEFADSLSRTENSMKQELDSYRKELVEEHQDDGDSKTSILRDLDWTRSERSHADRKRRRVFDDDNSKTGNETREKSGRKGRRKGGRTGVVREASSALRLPIEAEKPGNGAERLASWEIDQDLRAMDKTSSTRGRSSRPPAKLKDAQ